MSVYTVIYADMIVFVFAEHNAEKMLEWISQ